MVEVLSVFLQQLVIGNWKVFVYSLIQAILFIVIGVAVGKLVAYGLHKLASKGNLAATIKPSFIDLFIAVIKWSLYILFLEFAMEQLNIPQLTNIFSSILLSIPALVGALFLIGIGFVLASYLKDVIEESRVLNWEILSNLVFFFIVYVFTVFALKTALIYTDSMIVNLIIVILTAVVSATLAIWFLFRRPRKKQR